MGHAQGGHFFLAEITKRDHQLSERFYFIKTSYVLTELYFSILSNVFCQKSVIYSKNSCGQLFFHMLTLKALT